MQHLQPNTTLKGDENRVEQEHETIDTSLNDDDVIVLNIPEDELAAMEGIIEFTGFPGEHELPPDAIIIDNNGDDVTLGEIGEFDEMLEMPDYMCDADLSEM